jgi:hypothetical protein
MSGFFYLLFTPRISWTLRQHNKLNEPYKRSPHKIARHFMANSGCSLETSPQHQLAQTYHVPRNYETGLRAILILSGSIFVNIRI